MSYIGLKNIDDTLTFYVNTQVFATGVATDADAVPDYRVYEDETGTAILTGSMALLDSANTAGFYSEQITLSAANGFEVGKSYSIYISATVSGVAGATHKTFQVVAPPATAAALAVVDGIVDDILLDTAEIGAAGAGLTNINLPNQTMDIVGNITGNLSGSVGSVTGAVGSVTGAVGSVTGNVGGNVVGSVGSVVGAVGSVTGAVGSVTGNVGGNVTGTIGGLTAAALKDFFDTDSTTTYASAVAGSVVKEIADNAGGSSLSEAGIADAVWDEARAGHVAAGSFGEGVASVTSGVNVTMWNGSAVAIPTVAGVPEVDVTHWAGVVQTESPATPEDIAEAVGTYIDAGSVVKIENLTNTAGDIVTTTDAIKTKTDSLTFTVPNQLDSNIQYVNDVEVNGDGSPGTPWGP